MEARDATPSQPPATASDPGGPPPSARTQASQLPQRIGDAAVTLFSERGYAATSMRDIARRAQCTKPALYYHYASKQDLFCQVLRREMSRLIESIESTLTAPNTVRDRMLEAAKAFLAHARNHPASHKLVMRAEMHPERDQPAFDFKSYREHMKEKVHALLAEGVDRGEVRDEVDFDVAMDALGGALDSRVMLWVIANEPIPDNYPEQLIDTVFRGLAP